MLSIEGYQLGEDVMAIKLAASLKGVGRVFNLAPAPKKRKKKPKNLTIGTMQVGKTLFIPKRCEMNPTARMENAFRMVGHRMHETFSKHDAGQLSCVGNRQWRRYATLSINEANARDGSIVFRN